MHSVRKGRIARKENTSLSGIMRVPCAGGAETGRSKKFKADAATLL